jgi:2'-hydroxyisoflavone reductase
MRLLILGGTVFLGRHLVDAALAQGHSVTTFTRGQHDDVLPPEVERVHGERDGGLDALRGRRWDAAIDTSGYVPRVVRASAALLAESVEHYTFVSSISALGDVSQPCVDESGPVATLADESVAEVTGETYGALKALCERAAEAGMPGRALTIRPGLIVGPYDPTDRFTYWPYRVAAGGEVLAPGRPERAVQLIDARDLAEWAVRMVEGKRVGTFNATGPAAPRSMGELLDTCRTVSGSDARFTWVDEAFLLDRGVEPWMELPLWVPESDPDMGGFMAVNCSRARDAGLTFRPWEETVSATLAWDATRPVEREWKAGMRRERETALLDEWRARAQG